MPFYLRKSVRAGPFRFNFSKSGVGLSVGVKGLRFGAGPRGHYIHAGRGGLYYRASLGHSSQKGGHEPKPVQPRPDPPPSFQPDTVDLVEIESGDVLGMRDEKFSSLLDEISAKQSQFSKATLLAGLFALSGAVTFYFLEATLGAVVLSLTLPAWGFGLWLDSFKRRSVLFYGLDDHASATYEAMTKAFDQMAGCRAKWHIEASGAVADLRIWKQNAGADTIVRRKGTSLGYGLPKVIASNITPAMARIGRQIIYFMPDVAFVVDSKRVGAISYRDLNLHWVSSRFIEDGSVPVDAQVIDRTWQHPNKKGGPDRRFASNRQIPVCLYENLLLSSDSGLNELLTFSRTGVCEPFVRAVQQLAALGERSEPSLEQLQSRIAALAQLPS